MKVKQQQQQAKQNTMNNEHLHRFSKIVIKNLITYYGIVYILTSKVSRSTKLAGILPINVPNR